MHLSELAMGARHGPTPEVLGGLPDLAEPRSGKQEDLPGLTHHNSESGLAGKPCLLVKSKLLDHIFATFRQCIGEYSAL